MELTLVIHHGGKWSLAWEKAGDNIQYIGGYVGWVTKIDVDKLGYFFFQGIINELEYERGCRIWFKIKGIEGKDGFEEIEKDTDVSNMLFYNSGEKEIDIYFEEMPLPCTVVDSEGKIREVNNLDEEIEAEEMEVEERMEDNNALALVQVEVETKAQPEEEKGTEFGEEAQPNADAVEEVQAEVERVDGNNSLGVAQVEVQTEAQPEEEEAGTEYREEEQPNVDAAEVQAEVEIQAEVAVEKAVEADGSVHFDWYDDCVVSDQEVQPEEVEGESTGESFSWSEDDDSCDEDYVANQSDSESEGLEIPEDFEFTKEDMPNFKFPLVGGEDDLHSPVNSDNEGQQSIYYNEVSGELCTGMLFTGPKQFREAFRRWSVEREYCHHMPKNSPALITAVCKEKCGFRIRVAKMRDSNTMQIRTFQPNHSCAKSRKFHMVNSKFLANKYLNDFKENPDWKVGVIRSKVQRELSANVHPNMAYRAKVRALEMINGEESAQYKRLYDWGATVMKTNPGSKVVIKTELQLVNDTNSVPSVPREIVAFQYMYVRFSPMKIGYNAGIRPFICLDGCHLKTRLGGQLLSAVAKDGNDQLFPIGLAIVDIECKESWKWFIQLLFEDYGKPDETGWVFMSDQQKGLIEALNELEPTMEHRFCVKHMYENMKKVFKGEEYRKKLWSAACAGTERLFMRKMTEIEEFDKNAYEWIMRHNPKTWARCYFSEDTKCDAVQNNTCESWNAEILEARNMPILAMFEWIRKHLMEQHYEKQCQMENYKGPISPNIQLGLEKLKVDSRNWFCTPAGDGKYEVHSGAIQATVDLDARTCTCRLWQLSGIPCKHAISAIYSNREIPENYVHKFYWKSTYLAVYKHMYVPVPSEDDWERTDYPDIEPWIVKTPPGRPKKKRVKAADEPKNPYKCSRSGVKVRCGRCKQLGHNVRKCKASLTVETAWQTRKRKEAQRGNSRNIRNRPKRRSQSSEATTQPACSINMSQPAYDYTQPSQSEGISANMPQVSTQPSQSEGISANMPQVSTQPSQSEKISANMPQTSSTSNMGILEPTTSLHMPHVNSAMRGGTFARGRTSSGNTARGRPSSGRTTTSHPFMPPRPHYTAETISAASKRRRANPAELNNVGGPSRTIAYNNPRRAETLEGLARRLGNIN